MYANIDIHISHKISAGGKSEVEREIVRWTVYGEYVCGMSRGMSYTLSNTLVLFY